MNQSNDMKALRNRGYRLTPQRLAVLTILEEHHGHMTPAEIYSQATDRLPGITEATIYRALDFLSLHGLILVAHMGSGHLVYEASGHVHHHLICRDCGYTVEIEHEFLQELYNSFESKTGFQIDCAHVTFFGLCPGCKENERPALG